MKKVRKAGLVAILVSLRVVVAAVAGPLEDAQAAYEKGDYATALQLWRSLAAQDVAIAQSYLGMLYQTGRGVPQDYAQAVTWYRKAADQGEAVAQMLLGTMYEQGRGVPQDYVQAHMWLNLAAARFSATEVENRRIAGKYRDIITAKMTPAQIAEAQQLAREWKPK